jgi:FMN-dependent NADH-azoreductase
LLKRPGIFLGGNEVSKVLYVKANPKPESMSRTFKISESFIQAYKDSHPQDDITTLDLYTEGIQFLTAENISEIFGEKTTDCRNIPLLKYAYQFAEAEKYIVAEPIWNLGIPAILKAYIDYVSVVGVTFRYSETGPIGLLSRKKAINITARGGDYASGPYVPYEMCDRYLRTIFGFFGITDFVTISADGLDIVGNDVDAIVRKAIDEAKEKAKHF